jgi:hypothetical protein
MRNLPFLNLTVVDRPDLDAKLLEKLHAMLSKAPQTTD